MDHEVRDETTRRFIAGLRKLEQEGDLDALATLVTDDAEVKSIDGHGPRTGPDGMRELFGEYLKQFDRISTTFTQVTEGESHSALEWSSDATLPGGHEITYTGVTIIDLDGDAVSGFRTCYDSAALMRPTAGAHPAQASGGADSGDKSPDDADSTSDPSDTGVQASQGEPSGEDDGENVGQYGADTGFIDEADRDAAKGANP